MEELAKRVEDARAAIVDVLERIEDIELQQNPRIEADYQVKIGCWEVKVLEAELAARRARRRCEMAQAALNRGVLPDAEAIELHLEEELADWLARSEAAGAAYAEALAFRAGRTALSAAESAELKRLHRALVRRLHPDINPGESEVVRFFFELAQRAYEKGDLDMLRSLEVSTRELEHPDDLAAATLDELEVELGLAEAQLAVLEERLEQLMDSWPFNLAPLLENPDWVRRRQAELRQRVMELEESTRVYDARYANLMGGMLGEVA